MIFDSKVAPGSGWACKAGQDPFRIEGIHSLPNDTLWMVSIDNRSMIEAGLARHAFYRADDFLRLKMVDMLRELGLLDVNDEPSEPDLAAYVVAHIFDRVIRMTCLVTGVPREQWKPHLYANRLTLRQALIPQDPELPSGLAEAVRESIQHYTSCQTEGGYRRHLGFLPTMRLNHALKVMDTPVPTDMSYRGISVPGVSAQVPEWIAEQEGPMLIRATVEGFPARINRLVNFGGVTVAHSRRPQQGFLEQSASTRSWITSDEALAFSHLGELKVHEAVVFPNWTRVNQIKAVRRFIDSLENLDFFSYSVGLFAENLWTGLSSSNPALNATDNAINPITPFLRAADRLTCLEHAVSLADQDYEVRGYGVGRVGVLLNDPAGVNDEAAKIAATAELVPPMPRRGVSTFESPPTVSEDQRYQTLLGMMTSGLLRELMEVDQEVVDGFQTRASLFSAQQDINRAAS